LGVEIALETLHLQGTISQPADGQHGHGVATRYAQETQHDELLLADRLLIATIAPMTM
jgi:hypothetical protein